MRLRELRLERRLTQSQVGAVIGKSAPTVYRLETGLSPILLTDVLKLAAFFGVSLQELIGNLPTAKAGGFQEPSGLPELQKLG